MVEWQAARCETIQASRTYHGTAASGEGFQVRCLAQNRVFLLHLGNGMIVLRGAFLPGVFRLSSPLVTDQRDH
jgi:hypothetical protein